MTDEQSETTHFSPETVPSWREYLKAFEAGIMPIFEKHGISRDAAIIAFGINGIENAIKIEADAIRKSLADDGDEWKIDPDEEDDE